MAGLVLPVAFPKKKRGTFFEIIFTFRDAAYYPSVMRIWNCDEKIQRMKDMYE
jgi:hypothetical protein